MSMTVISKSVYSPKTLLSKAVHSCRGVIVWLAMPNNVQFRPSPGPGFPRLCRYCTVLHKHHTWNGRAISLQLVSKASSGLGSTISRYMTPATLLLAFGQLEGIFHQASGAGRTATVGCCENNRNLAPQRLTALIACIMSMS